MALLPRFPKYCAFVVIALLVALCIPAFSQTESATISGTITDQTGAALVGAEVKLTNVETNNSATVQSNGTGLYVFSFVRPGKYRIEVNKEGFKQIALTDVTVHVQDTLSRNFQMQVGALGELITVNGDAILANTESATVSTVIHEKFLQEIPLNGRSIQPLLMLTPGVVFTVGGSSNSQGQFSVNGMRTDANYFSVDGVAANLGTDTAGNGLPEAASGAAPGFNSLGGTNSLVSVDAIQEFRVQTSTFAPEYGRTPGAQVGIVTRSGSNAWHGTLFEYLRNDIFDAKDWFNGYNNNPPLPKAKERQNSFGGVLGGPVIKDRTFFFFSYEGLRLRQPKTLQSVVPDQTARNNAPAALKPFLDAYPKANGAALTDNLAEYNASISLPSTVNAYSLRLDQAIGSRVQLFGRYSYSPSSTATANALPNNLFNLSITTHTFTLGLDATLTNKISNALRVNYSNLRSLSRRELTTAGGAVPISQATFSQLLPAGVDPGMAQLSFQIFDANGYFVGRSGLSEQRQVNLVDDLTVARGSHIFKLGADFRFLAPFQGASPYYLKTYFATINGPGGVLSGQTLQTDVTSFGGVSVRSKNLSLYAQDTWRTTSRLTLTYGLRWDLNPAPRGSNSSSDPLVVTSIKDPATMALAPRGTPFYETRYWNFAPRFAVAYQLRGDQGRETVIRAGIGTFFDLGSGSLGSYTLGYPFRADNSYPGAAFPLTPAQAAPPQVNLSGPAGFIYVADPHLVVPRTYQWNVAVEQALGSSQTLSITYLGALGRKLLRQSTLFQPNANFSSGVSVTTNQAASNYQALQIKFQRQVTRGLQAIASYTYSHSIDTASDSFSGYSPILLGDPSIDRASSDFDVRHSVSGAVTYDLPQPSHGPARAILGGWSVQNLLIARTGFPVNLVPFTNSQFIGPYIFTARPNVVPGVPLYLYGNQYPGGKAFNPAAFTDPAPGTQGNLGRNALRGFGVWQDNFAIHRQFALTEKVNLQFRAEAFNLFNHPNFADPDGFWPVDFPAFGISRSTVANTASFNGQNALYGVGGARSWQFGLRLQF